MTQAASRHRPEPALMGLTVNAGSPMFRGQKKDTTRCEAFLRDHMGLLFRVAASYEAIPALREDLLQEIVVAVWQASTKFEGRSSFKTFALRVAHNRAISHVARESRRPVSAPLLDTHPDPGVGPEQLVEKQSEQEQLLSAIRQLPVAQRQILGLALEGLSYQEIAEVLGITANNVGVRLNRAKKQLMDQFDE